MGPCGQRPRRLWQVVFRRLPPPRRHPRDSRVPAGVNPEWIDPIPNATMNSDMVRNWQRLFALLLLFWMFADLGLQGICCKADVPIPSPKEGISLVSEGNGQKSPGECAEDGCFCCCTHILPTPRFELTLDSKLALEGCVVGQQVPREFHAAVYHPPRT